jgi:hypothetical protein
MDVLVETQTSVANETRELALKISRMGSIPGSPLRKILLVSTESPGVVIDHVLPAHLVLGHSVLGP